MSALDRRLAELRDRIELVTPEESRRRQQNGALLLDIREAEETLAGMAENAVAVPRGLLELRIASLAAPDRSLMLMCESDTRSLLAADDLERLGFTELSVVEGGFSRWKMDGLPWSRPESADADTQQRYARQLVLPDVGPEGQQRLGDARVLVVGAGGLGSPAALYLAAAGIGTLGLVDDDRVERSNLHRQVLHRDDRVGWKKTDSAAATLTALNPRVTVRRHPLRLDAANVESVFAGYQFIVDGSDNFSTRYLVNDACLHLGLPCIYGAVQGFEGQVALFTPQGQPCYRCLFSAPPPPGLAPSCAEAGVLGVVPGIVGLLQALEVIKLVLGLGDSLAGRLLLFDARTTRLRELRPAADPDCSHCAPGRTFRGYERVAEACETRND